MADTTVLVIRDPDWENEYVTEGGEIDTITVDLGSQFNGPKDFDPDSDWGREWLEDLRSRVEHLDPDGAIRQRVDQLIAELTDR